MEAGRRASGAARLAATAALALAALPGCGGADGGSPADAQPGPKATVLVTDGAYVPARVTVTAPSRVTFVSNTEQGNTAETGGAGFFEYDRERLDRENYFDIHTLQLGEAESVELDTPGTYRYYSSLDGDMEGVIEVVAPPR